MGSKRREITPEACDEIARIYAEMLNGDGKWGDVSKIFATTDFGYREIRVERPRKVVFKGNAEQRRSLEDTKAFQKYDLDFQNRVMDTLYDKFDEVVFAEREHFLEKLKLCLEVDGIEYDAKLIKMIIASAEVPGEKGEIQRDAKGKVLPDTSLRDHELVPLDENWRDYVQREVLPFVPDAWVDESYTDAQDGEVGRVGYEINFNRYFYQYVPPRPLAGIDAELKALEGEIAGLLREVVE